MKCKKIITLLNSYYCQISGLFEHGDMPKYCRTAFAPNLKNLYYVFQLHMKHNSTMWITANIFLKVISSKPNQTKNTVWTDGYHESMTYEYKWAAWLTFQYFILQKYLFSVKSVHSGSKYSTAQRKYIVHWLSYQGELDCVVFCPCCLCNKFAASLYYIHNLKVKYT